MRTRTWMGGLLGVALLAGPSGLRAAEADPLLPEDTEAVICLNVKQLMGSGVVKKYALDAMKNAIQGSAEASAAFEKMGLDPLKDFEKVTVAAGTATPEKPLIIVRGKFDKAKIEKALKDHADKDDKLKVVKIGGTTAFEMAAQNQTFLTAVLSDSAIVMTPGEDQLKAAAKQATATKASIKSKKLAELIEKADSKQSLQMLAVNTKTDGKVPDIIPANIALLMEKIDTMTLGITVADDVKLAIAVNATDADAAKEMNDLLQGGLGIAKKQAAAIAKQAQGAGDLIIDLANTAKTDVSGSTINITGTISAKAIEKTASALNKQ